MALLSRLNFLFFIELIAVIHNRYCQGQILLNNLNFEDQQPWTKLMAEFDASSDHTKSVVTDALHNFFEKIKSSSFPTAVANLTNQKCVSDSQLYVHTLYSLTGSNTSWARQMHESSGDYVPLGFFANPPNLHSDGLFDECLAVRGPPETDIRGQYCTVFLSLAPVDESELLPKNQEKSSMVTIFQLINKIIGGIDGSLEPKVAKANSGSYRYPSTVFCLPSSCTADDLGQAVAQLVGTNVIANYSVITITDEGFCFKDDTEPKPLDASDISFIVLLSIIGLFVLIATLLEVWKAISVSDIPSDSTNKKSDGVLMRVVHCFSFLNNGRKVLSMKTMPSGGTSLDCLHGIRVLSTTWVVMLHTWNFGTALVHNPSNAMENTLDWWFQGVWNATVSVDTFFVMSGLLVSYNILRELDRNKGKFNIGLLYLHRYIRLTLVYAFLIGFAATLMVYMGTGPYSFQVVNTSNSCRVVWWKNLLYIQNLFTPVAGEYCIGQAWYLAVDMQLFVIAPFFIYLLWRWPTAGLSSLALATIATVAANFIVFSLVDLQPTVMISRPGELGALSINNEYYYDVPWTRAPPYFIGIVLGWLLLKTNNNEQNLKMPKIIIATCWIISLGIFGAVVYGLFPYLNEQTVPEIPFAVTLTYGALHRTAWAIAVAWVIYACVRGYGGIFVNRFLSWKGFIPLGRLTYCVYLIHYDYLNIFFCWNRKFLYYTFMGMLTTYLGVVMTVFGLAFLVSTTVEVSFMNLEKFIFTKPSASQNSKKTAKVTEDGETVKLDS